ncbi:hypothetical protein [Actinoplanes aureus]|uniref:CDP-diglyceride synthetase n=1 Tax=Actinoplanes aureus TaxID=2792083 RepID=A0A931G0I3_9ACTN|nr:hypothetical protein [Actinoplanes aureus]
MPQDDPWDAEASQQVARMNPGRPKAGFYGAVPDGEDDQSPSDDSEDGEEFEEIEVVPVRPKLSVAIAGFAALLAIALTIGAQTTGPNGRLSYAIVLFGVQLLGLLAWTMALHPPAAAATAGVVAVTALIADYLAVSGTSARFLPLLFVALGGFVVAMIGQVIRAGDRQRAKDSWRSTLLIVLGAVAYAILLVLTRQPLGAQTILVCCTGAGVALMVARLTDAVFPKPRIAAQVPRGATGIVLGAMLGTLAAAMLGSYLVLPFTPAKGAVLGLVAAVAANLVDLAVNFGEAGRRLAGEAPTFWLARHMQGPLGGFALTAAAAYALTHWYLT